MHEILLKPLTSTEPIYVDTLLLGGLIAYDSPDDTHKSLTANEREGYYIWLVEVTNNGMLQQMLEPEHELCQPNAAQYIRLDLMCPVRWLIREDDGGADIDLVSQVPPSASQACWLYM